MAKMIPATKSVVKIIASGKVHGGHPYVKLWVNKLIIKL